ncbi:MAG: dihydrofolate reductase [Oligoflexales bacterium]
MDISLIVAVGLSGQLGLDQGLPWSVKGDLKRFKKMTMGHHLVVGRKTWETLPPLPGRHVMVMSRKKVTGDCDWVESPNAAIEMARSRGETRLFFAGGAQVYQSAFNLAQTIEMTTIHYDGDADTWFPQWDASKWKIIDEGINEEEKGLSWGWKTYQRCKKIL